MSVIIKVISFDLDNTLWENDSVIIRAEKAGYEWLENNVPALTERYSLKDLVHHRLELLEKHPHLIAQIGELRKLALREILQTINHPESSIEETAEQGFLAMYHERCKVKPFPETKPVLNQLGKNFQLASLTNGNSNLAVIGLDGYFDLSLSAEDIDSRKPDRKMFETMLEYFNCTPQEVVHVGDHPHDDVHGANEMGIHSVWFNPDNKNWQDVSEQNKPAEIIDCLTQIEEAIKRIQSG